MNVLRKPAWLKSSKLGARKASEISHYLREYNLHTVCESARCPNRGECFERGTATFMILGERCTRRCSFCAVEKELPPLSPDLDEPRRIAELVNKLKLKHVVVTTVTRDDLADGGARHFVAVISAIHRLCPPDTTVEVLVSDLQGVKELVAEIIDARPDVFNHNIETVSRLYPRVRPGASYERSLQVLRFASELNRDLITKSGFMVGLGETEDEIMSLMKDLRDSAVDILTIGQYMSPSRNHYPVQEYIKPAVFSLYKGEALKLGFSLVESAPLVRSSYRAERVRKLIKKRG
ncbi:MAG: lipoyl synthase [Candidatus Cloacimonetes bacterium]|nr:lipoyl synthase [Candidatus Cloacimonadota bacterium]